MSVSASVMREMCGGDCSVSVLLDPKGKTVVSTIVCARSLFRSTT